MADGKNSKEPVTEDLPKYIPEVGDDIVITKGFTNWNSNMNEYIGKIGKVTKIVDTYTREIKHDITTNFRWYSTQGHFRKATKEDFLKAGITPEINDIYDIY